MIQELSTSMQEQEENALIWQVNYDRSFDIAKPQMVKKKVICIELSLFQNRSLENNKLTCLCFMVGISEYGTENLNNKAR